MFILFHSVLRGEGKKQQRFSFILLKGCKRYIKKSIKRYIKEKKQFLPNLLRLMVHLARPTAEICALYVRESVCVRVYACECVCKCVWVRVRVSERFERMRKQFLFDIFSFYEWLFYSGGPLSINEDSIDSDRPFWRKIKKRGIFLFSN